MIFQAHRGVSSEYPENTMPAYVAAVEQGYKVIELDVKVTSDFKFVLLHDKTINRTARYKSGELVTDIIEIGNITYKEALSYDYGMWFSEKFCGTEIPLLEDVLKFARQNNVKIKIDNCYRYFTDKQKELLFEILLKYQDVACLTCFVIEEIKKAVEIFEKMEFHYDGLVNIENLEILDKILPKERLTVWLAHKNPSTLEVINESLASLVKKYAKLGIWILSTREQLFEAEKLGADIIETNGMIKPH